MNDDNCQQCVYFIDSDNSLADVFDQSTFEE